jgi:hypothetical protein
MILRVVDVVGAGQSFDAEACDVGRPAAGAAAVGAEEEGAMVEFVPVFRNTRL